MQHLRAQEKPRMHNVRTKLGKGHTLGQLAPEGRLAENSLFTSMQQSIPLSSVTSKSITAAATGDATAASASASVDLPTPTSIAVLAVEAPAECRDEETGPVTLPALHAGTFVEVFEERFGGMAVVAPAPELSTV